MKHLIWELPIRVFHWSLAIVFTIAWFTQDDKNLYYHILAGYIFTALLVFRLTWGKYGEYYSQFKHFFYSPQKTVAYVKQLYFGQTESFIGHNPAGSWAIFIIFILGFSIIISGFITFGAEELHGPLKGVFSFKTGDFFHQLHELLATLLLFVVALHIIGVLGESFIHHENLVLSMITGKKTLKTHQNQQTAKAVNKRTKTALILALCLGLFSFWWLKPFIVNNTTFQFSHSLPVNELWKEECGACHLAYFPGLLSEASWIKLLKEQSNHFSEDLSLEDNTIRELQKYALKNSRPPLQTEASWKIQNSIKINTIPIQITKTPYWLSKHLQIPDKTWTDENISGSFNCPACHLDAETGWFDDKEISYKL